MQVFGSDPQASVPQHELDLADIYPVLQLMGGERVAQCVGGNRLLDTGCFFGFVDHVSHRVPGNRLRARATGEQSGL